jgi:hypothetical protein
VPIGEDSFALVAGANMESGKVMETPVFAVPASENADADGK